jgi:hypothetical protein
MATFKTSQITEDAGYDHYYQENVCAYSKTDSVTIEGDTP